MTRLGINFVPTLPPSRLQPLARAADAAGLDELWIWEDCFKESAVASAAAALAWTERITVVISLMPVPLRNPALCAMEVATLAGMFPGRFIAGLGHGVQEWMGQAGARVESPLTLLEEYATAVRRLLAGERVTTDGRYVRLDDVALDWPPAIPPPLMLGGTGPKSVALAARLGDGNLLGLPTNDQIRDACELIRQERAQAEHPVLVQLIAATGPGAEERVAAEVPRWFESADLGIGAAGNAATIAQAISRLADLGATSVGIQPTEDEPDLEGFVEFLGREVKPLLSD